MIEEREGFIGVRDAAGTDIAIQYGQAGGHAVIRVQQPGAGLLSFVGCAPTTAAEN